MCEKGTMASLAEALLNQLWDQHDHNSTYLTVRLFLWCLHAPDLVTAGSVVDVLVAFRGRVPGVTLTKVHKESIKGKLYIYCFVLARCTKWHPFIYFNQEHLFVFTNLYIFFQDWKLPFGDKKSGHYEQNLKFYGLQILPGDKG